MSETMAGRRGLAWLACFGIGIPLAVLGGGAARAAAASPAPVYVRLVVNPEVTVYAGFTGDEVRLALAAADVGKATPVKATAGDARRGLRFASVPLPVPADRLPGQATQARCTMALANGQFRLMAVELVGADGQAWACVVFAASATGKAPASAPPVGLPLSEPLTLTLVPSPDPTEKGRLGVGVRAALGAIPVAEVLKGGAPAEVEFRLLGADGKLGDSVRKPISQAGFA